MYTWVERKKNRFCLKKIAYLRTYTSEVTCRNFSYIYPVSLISLGQKMSARGLNGCHWGIDFKNKRKISETTFLMFLIRERENFTKVGDVCTPCKIPWRKTYATAN